MFTEMKEFKIVMIGDEEVGKTSLLKRICVREFDEQYIPTLGVEVHPIQINTNYGKIQFNVWDCAGKKQLEGLAEGYYVNANACIGVIECEKSYKIKYLKKKINNNASLQNVPVVYVMNKFDCNPQIMPFSQTNMIVVSAKDGLNLLEPFLVLAQRLTNLPDLELAF